MFRTHFIGGLLLCALLCLGCGDDDDGDPTDAGSGHPPAEMVGSWIFQSVTVDGVPANLADVQEWQPATVEARLHIQTNSAYVYDEVDAGGGQLWWESGFVFINGSEMDINVQQDGDGPLQETFTVTFTLDSGVFTITEVDMGSTVVFTLEM